jgi:hypothetical protein
METKDKAAWTIMRRPNSGVMYLDLLININIGFSSIAGIFFSFEFIKQCFTQYTIQYSLVILGLCP